MVMVWGCFCWLERGGPESLKFDEMMNGVSYWQVLEDQLELFMDQHDRMGPLVTGPGR